MKRVYAATISTCLLAVILVYVYKTWINPNVEQEKIYVGFVYDSDESTSYTYNFSLAADELKKTYDDRIEILSHSNVLDDETEEPLRDLVNKGCSIIFLNGYSPQVLEVAKEYPEVQFCQASWKDMSEESVPENYHTFKGEAYQARYVSGIAAGSVLRQLIDRRLLTPEEACIGYVAAFPDPEVISGYTAFLLGARSVAPEAFMRVRYTGTWGSFSLEKRMTEELIQEGCVIISQHTDTIGPVLACEEASLTHNVYHVAYNQSLLGVAPRSALIAARINWTPYIVSAVEAVLNRETIESVVKGNVHGNDVSAGFEYGWVEVMDLNAALAAPGTKEKIDEAIGQFKTGNKRQAFKTDVKAVSVADSSVTIDLNGGFLENERSSYPSFYYLLPDIISAE